MGKWLCILLVIVSFATGLYIGTKWFINKTEKETVRVDVILEQIKEVFKVVNVEGRFSEIFNRKEYLWFDISPLRKSAVIRIQAKVLAGFDMDSVQFITDEKSKTIRMKLFQEPMILAIDHSLDYYDLQQGSFNYFSPDEMSAMQQTAIDIIRKKADQSDLLKRSKERMTESLQWIQMMVKPMGWTLVVETLNNPPQTGYPKD